MKIQKNTPLTSPLSNGEDLKSPYPPLHKGGNVILALGAESAGSFSILNKGKIYLSENFGDLLDEKNFQKFQKAVLDFLKKNKIKPNIILTDLHPLYKTTLWGAELAKKFSAKGGSASGGKTKHIQVQHHLAHIFSAIGEQLLQATSYKLQANSIGIALDGTGYGLDGKIWGGEVFQITNSKSQIQNKLKIQNSKFKTLRFGHLENQIMIGGDLAVREPARMLLAILAKTPPLIKGAGGISRLVKNKSPEFRKNFIYNFIKKYYTRNQFELLYNQLQSNFNCLETSSAGRILDAVSILLGFCGNERKYKHEPIDLLEKNSTLPYRNLMPKIMKTYNKELRITRFARASARRVNYELNTTYLFEYLIKNIKKDKKRLAATAQLYIAQGLYEIINKEQKTRNKKQGVYFAGGVANNKIISSYFESKGAIANKKVPRGDAGLSLGQTFYFLGKPTIN